MYPDPIRRGDDVLVLCSVYNPNNTPHTTNTRALLENLLTPAMIAEKPLYGFEQVCHLMRCGAAGAPSRALSKRER